MKGGQRGVGCGLIGRRVRTAQKLSGLSYDEMDPETATGMASSLRVIVTSFGDSVWQF